MAKWTMWTNYIIGKGITDFTEITSYVNDISWTDDVDTLCVSLGFTSILDLAEGRSHIVLKKDDNTVFSGRLINKTNNDKKATYTAQDYFIFLNTESDRSFQFTNISAKQAIYQILNYLNIGGACTELNTIINKLYLQGKTYTDTIKDILSQCAAEVGEDVIMEMRANNVLWIDRISNLKLDCKYILGNDYGITRSMENMINDVVVIASNSSGSSDSDTTSTSAILAEVKDENNIGIFGRLTKVLSLDKTEAEAQNIAQTYLNNFDSTSKQLTTTLLDIEGCENLRANRKIYIDLSQYGVKDYYKVKSASHTISAGGIHKIQVTIDFSGVSFQDPTSNISTDNNTTDTATTTDSSSSKADEIIAYAKTFLGVLYVWGGTTPSGFDCSGFVQYVFNHFGYSLPRTTYEQVNAGTQVNVSDLQPCDLVFFYNTGHVGIYVGTDNFIQAPHTGDAVKISTFSGYYQDNCNAAVRILN